MKHYAYIETREPGPRSPGERVETSPAVYPYRASAQERNAAGDTIFRRFVGCFDTFDKAWKAAEAALNDN